MNHLSGLLAEAWKVVVHAVPGAPPEVQAAALPLVWEELLRSQTARSVGRPVAERDIARVPIGELVNRVRPATFWEKVIVVGYWLESEGNAPFVVGAIKSGLEKARQKLPKNLSDALSEAVRRGYVAEAAQGVEGKRAYYLTDTGRAFVEERLSVGGDRK